jgi:hypothetical protein
MKVAESRSVHMRSVGLAGNCGERNLVDHETSKEHGFDQTERHAKGNDSELDSLLTKPTLIKIRSQ